MFHHVTPEELDTLVQKNLIVFVDFWAEWCAPCKPFAVVYEEISQEYPEIIFAKVDIGTEPKLAELFEIRSIPHLLIFKQGMIIYSESGSMPKSRLKELVVQTQIVEVKT